MTTPTQSAAPAPKPERKPAKISIGAIFSAIGLLLLEVILPVIVAAGLLGYVFGAYNVWGLERTLALVLYGAAVFILALVLSVLLDSLLAATRSGHARLGARFGNNANLRFIKMAVGGAVVPLAVIIAANLITIPNAGTPMSLLISAAQHPAVSTPPGEVGKVTLAAKNPATKLLGIQVLQSFKSPEAMAVLLQIARDDRAALSNPATKTALIQALASYGGQARPALTSLFSGIEPTRQNKSGSPSAGLYERYFTGIFETMLADTISENSDPAARDARSAQIEALQARLKSDLAALEESTAAADGAEPRLDFVVQTFLAMNLTSDKDLLTFARTTAADPRYSSQVRGDALLLIAKVGDKSDLDGLFPYLKDGDDLLQARALQAILALQEKVSHTVGK